MKIFPCNKLQMATNFLNFQWQEVEPKYLNPLLSYFYRLISWRVDSSCPEILTTFKRSWSRLIKLSLVLGMIWLRKKFCSLQMKTPWLYQNSFVRSTFAKANKACSIKTLMDETSTISKTVSKCLFLSNKIAGGAITAKVSRVK